MIIFSNFVFGRMNASQRCAFCWRIFTFFCNLYCYVIHHITHTNDLLQHDLVWPYCWHLIHCMILFLFTRGSSVCKILFCNTFVLYISFLFSAGSKSTKNKFNVSVVGLFCAFIMFRSLCPGSNSSCFISSLSVE